MDLWDRQSRDELKLGEEEQARDGAESVKRLSGPTSIESSSSTTSTRRSRKRMRKTMKTRSHLAAVDDPFERLPEHILHHILALLRSNKEAAKTSVVSRTWHRAWSSHPIFDFRVSDFRPRGPECSAACYSPGERQEINDRFLDFVDKAISRLRHHRIGIPLLSVHAMHVHINHSRALFDKWIAMALDSSALALLLDFDGLDNQDNSYSVPARVFESGSIKYMVLDRVLVTPLESISTVNLSSLQTLCLYRTPLNELMLQKLLRGCPLLEELKLFSCTLFSRVVISSPNNLRSIYLTGQVNRVEIEAPRLEEFVCDNTGPITLLPQFVLDPRLGTLLTHVIMDRCPRVKHLKLRNCATTQVQFQELLSKFPLLECLSIRYCLCLEKIVILNPLLEKIEIVECEGLVGIEIESANLSYFLYETRKMRLPFIRMRNPTALSFCEANFADKWNAVPGPDWFIELREFLTRSCQFRSLSFDLDLFDLDEEYLQVTHDPLPLLPYNLEVLHLSIRTPQSSHAAILNMPLFHPASLWVRSNDRGCDFLKFVCEKLENRGGVDDVCCCCSTSGNRKCWLHELKGVEIERINCDDHSSGPLDWRTLHELLPNLSPSDDVYFKLL